jgi:hypothetical protein
MHGTMNIKFELTLGIYSLSFRKEEFFEFFGGATVGGLALLYGFYAFVNNCACSCCCRSARTRLNSTPDSTVEPTQVAKYWVEERPPPNHQFAPPS